MTADIAAASVFVLVTTFTPGPNNILCGSLAAVHGYRRTLPFMLGVAAGFLTIMLLCLTMSSLLVAHLPRVTPVLRVVGALYLLWLAPGVYRACVTRHDDAAPTAPLRFWNGWLLQFVNPKAILFGLMVYSVFLAPLLHSRVALVLSPLLLVVAAFGSVSAWALAGHLIRGWIRSPGRARLVGATLAAALIWAAWDVAVRGA